MLCGAVLDEITNISMFKMEHVVYMNLKVITIKKASTTLLNVCVCGGGSYPQSPVRSVGTLKNYVHDRQCANYITY